MSSAIYYESFLKRYLSQANIEKFLFLSATIRDDNWMLIKHLTPVKLSTT